MGKAISESIRKLRLKAKLSQEALAAKLGVSFTTVNRWENNKTIPRKETINKINNILNNKVLTVKNNKKMKAVSLFSGAGGFHMGIEDAGFDVLVASDIERVAMETHKLNWPGKPFLLKDIRKLSAQSILEQTKYKGIDLVFGGPPCQGFSTLGDKLSADPRNDLFEAYARIIKSLNPKCFIMENVKSLKTMYGGRFLNSTLQTFSACGYTLYVKVLNAADYGVPQIRHRLFIFGTRLNNAFAFPKPINFNNNGNKYSCVGDAILDLMEKDKNDIPNHLALNHSTIVIERYKLIPEGGKLPSPDKLPPEIRRKNFGNTYKRLHRNEPSLTMVPGNNAFPIHPILNRSLTPREAARIQTFPDTHVFAGDRRRQCILVGNAVPPILAENIGNQIKRHLNNVIDFKDREPPVNIIYSTNSSLSKLEFYLNYDALKRKNSQLGFIDLFSGAGGFTVGFAKAGWKPLLCVDNWSPVQKTHQKNYPNIPFLFGCITEKDTFKRIKSEFCKKNIGVIVGGPPCQGFSIFGNRRFIKTKGYDPHKDPRNKLVYSFINMVKNLSPRWFVMENVSGLANLDNGLFLKSILKEFKIIGYKNVDYKILNTAHYGVPQLRKRIIIIGNNTGHIIPWPKKKYFEFPKDWQKPFRTVGDVISDLADKNSFDTHTCHMPMNHKPLLVERYKHIKEGGKLDVEMLPKHLKRGYRTDKVKNYSHIYKRLHRKKPSITMVPGHNAFPIHPTLNRALTVREAARIQTFPDEIEFCHTRQNQCIQVGNAFPPLLAELIGINILKAEKNNWLPDSTPKSAYYSIIDGSNGDKYES